MAVIVGADGKMGAAVRAVKRDQRRDLSFDVAPPRSRRACRTRSVVVAGESGDRAARLGPGPRYWMGDRPPG